MRREEDVADLAVRLWAASAIFPFVVTFGVLVVQSAFPSPMEDLLPSRVTFTRASLFVTPTHGASFTADWSFVHEARRVAAGIDLILSREPYLVWFVADGVLPDADAARLERWLREQGKLSEGGA